MIRSLLSRLAAARPRPRGAAAASLSPEAVGAPARPPGRATLRDWAELLRVSALFTVPGDALAGAAAAGLRPNRGTALAVGASLCLYEAGMALNDWADRDEDAVDRPHRPIPSGRIAPGAALAAAGALTAAGLALASRAGRPALAVATALSATVWAYDLRLKHTAAGPAAMATARGLDLLLGATATLSATRQPATGEPRFGPAAAASSPDAAVVSARGAVAASSPGA
ncbi:UbiA family prenyltransferase, partial [Streptomyces sp. PKU-EA00015]